MRSNWDRHPWRFWMPYSAVVALLFGVGLATGFGSRRAGVGIPGAALGAALCFILSELGGRLAVATRRRVINNSDRHSNGRDRR